MRFRPVLLIITALMPFSLSGYNHPEIQWRSVPTEHFIINFYDKTECAVYPAWKIAEEVYEALGAAYDYKLYNKINISLADYDDYSNGWADWTSGNIMIWIPDMRIDLRSNTVWLRNVITHELTHILSLEKKRRRMQLLDVVANVALQTPSGSLAWQEPFPTVSMPPDWSAEGIAQLETQQRGNDCWDSRRDMLLRCAVLDNKILSLEEMGHFNHDNAGNEMVYNQGFSFSRYIEGKTGSDAYRSIWKQSANDKSDFYQLISEKTLKTADQLYKGWLDSLHAAYASMVPTKPTVVTPVWKKGYYNTVPRISGDGRYWGWLTSNSDDFGRTDLVIAEYGTARVVRTIKYAHTSWAFGGGNLVYFIRSREPDRNGSYFNDLFSCDIVTGKIVRLTRGGRIYDVAAAPGSKTIYCIRYNDGKFTIDSFDLQAKAFRNIVKGILGEPFMNISVHPADAKKAVVTRVVDGFSRLFLLSGDSLTAIPTGGSGQEESPFWAQDGKIYYSADYDGIFNIYSIDPVKAIECMSVVTSDSTAQPRNDTAISSSGISIDTLDSASRSAASTTQENVDTVARAATAAPKAMRCTDAIGGFFNPVIGPDNSLLASSFSSSGFSIVKCSSSPRTYSMPGAYRCSFEELPAPKGKVTIKSRSYMPMLSRPVWELQLFGMAERNSNLLFPNSSSVRDTLSYMAGAAIVMNQSDALAKKARYFGAAAGFTGGAMGNGPVLSGISMNKGIDPVQSSLQIIHRTAAPASEKYTGRQSGRYNLLNDNPAVYKSIIASAAADSMVIDSTDSSGNMTFPFIQPMVGWQGASGAATVGLNLQAVMLAMIIPVIIGCDLYSEWQLSRDVFFGVAPSVNFMPVMQTKFSGSVPFYLTWQHTGYLNENINYNLAGVTGLQLIGGPQLVPLVDINDIDTSYSSATGLKTGFSFFHGIPVTKNSSIVLSAMSLFDHFNTGVPDEIEVLQGKAHSYLSSELGVMAMLPLIPKINKRTGLYFDALYAQFGYTFWTRANENALHDRNNFSLPEMLSDPNADPSNLQVGHVLSAGINLGNYKSYTFFRMLSMSVSYELLREQFYFNLSMGL